MYHYFFVLLFLGSFLLTLSSCQRIEKDFYPETEYIDLEVSTKIIRNLIHSGGFGKILCKGTDVEGIELLVNNFSPSELAFEAEVLNSVISVVVLFINDDRNFDEIKKVMNKLARENKGQIRFVLVDSEALFKITSHSEVDEFPTLSLIHQRDEKKRIESFHIATLETQIHQLIAEFV